MTIYRVVNNWGNGYRIQRYSRHWFFWKKWKFIKEKKTYCSVQAVHTIWEPIDFSSKEDAQIEMVKCETEEFQKNNIKMYGWKIV